MAIKLSLDDLSSKIYLSIFIMVVFFLLYLTIPDFEFDNIKKENCKISRLYYTVTTHVGSRTDDGLKPVSKRAKLLTMAHMLLSYSILLV